MMALQSLQPTSANALIIGTSLLVIYIFVGAIYNVFFHPLAKVPGPFWAKISTLPSCYHSIKGDRHVWLWQNFQKYGHKIRAYPNGLVFDDPEVYNQIYGYKANVRRSNFYKGWQRNKDDVNTFNSTDRDVHKRKRRILNLVFTDKAVLAAGDFVYKHVDRWHELLAPVDNDGWTDARDIAHWLDCLVFDILGDLCFGRSFQIKEPGANPLKAVPHTIVEYMQFMYPIVRSPFIDAMIWLKPRGLDVVFEALTPKPVKDYFEFVKNSVTERIELEKDLKSTRDSGHGVRNDMFHFLMQAEDPETGKPAYSEGELRCEANLLIIAGSDTTSVSLSGFFFYISRHSRVYQKLVDEIRATFTTPEEIISSPELFNCEYLRACLLESLRLVPAAPSELSRTVLPGGTEIDGEFIPEGIDVGVVPFSLARNEDYIRDPNVFRPERFIANNEFGDTEESVAAAKKCVSNFSVGPMSCAGKNLAMLEMLTVIARTLHRMDVRWAPNTSVGEGRPELGWGRRNKQQYQLTDAYISIREGPLLQFKRRAVA